MGNLHPGGWPFQGQGFSRDGRQPSRVRALYHQPKGDGQVPGELSELLSCSGECQGTEEDGGSPGETRQRNDTGPDPSEDHGGKELKFQSQAPESEHAGGDRRAGVANDDGGERRTEADPCDSDCNAAEAAGSAGLDEFSNSGSNLERMDQPRERELSSEQVALVASQLDELCSLCEANLKEMIWSQPLLSKSQSISGKACASDLFEISCGFSAFISCDGNSSGLQAEVARPGIRDARVRSSTLEKVMSRKPRHLWFSIGFTNLSRAEKRIMLEWCEELYFNQIVQGNHFHLWAPRNFVQYLVDNDSEVVLGTLDTVYHLGYVPKIHRLKGNNYLRQRVEFRTTSLRVHEGLDHRYLSLKGYEHKVGYAAGFSKGFRNIAAKLGNERPLALSELCAFAGEKRDDPDTIAEFGQILKRRRCMYKQSPQERNGYGKSMVDWQHVFKKLNAKIPRVGNAVFSPEDEMIPLVQQLVPEMKVHHLEACRGVNRLRTPHGKYDQFLVSSRKTVVINRNTGVVEDEDPVERWVDLPRYKQVRQGRPAKVAVTIFGTQNEQEPPNQNTPPTDPAQDDKMNNGPPETNETPDRPPDNRHNTDRIAWGPPPVANHGPAFLKLNSQEQGELKQLHHNLGHPDPNKFMTFLRQGGACAEVQRAALDYQCDACTESKKGFMASRPAAIHENLAFNTKVGMDLVSWRSAQGTEFQFVHFIDEGTLFHLGAECSQGAEGVIELFEQRWVSWAGQPREVYVDPGGEFVSDAFAAKMQASGIHVHMSASDSHWQLGRTEIHGSTVKRMLTRMDLEFPIDSSEAFGKALRQVFNAKNTLRRASGHSPQQAVLGVAARLPGSILSDDDASSHALAESGTQEGGQVPEGQRFLQELRLRELARKAFVMTDNSSSFRRALLRRTRPQRDDWEVGDLVLYWKRRGGNLRREHGRWHGPAEIVAKDRKVVWLSHAGRLVRASPEQIRAASLREWGKIPKDEQGRPLSQGTSLKEQLRRSPQYVDLEGEELPPPEQVEDLTGPEVSEGSEPEAEKIPESFDIPMEAPDEEPKAPLPPSPSPNIPGMTMDELTRVQQLSQEIPVPEEDELFGDALIVEECSYSCGSDVVWEIDVTPPSNWDLPRQLDESMIFLASEGRKKRVEVKLRDLTVKDQQRFALAKHKEVRAWISHATVRKIAKGKIPAKNITRCRWIYTWKPAAETDEANPDGKKAKARLVVLGFEDPDIDYVSNDAPTLSKDGRHFASENLQQSVEALLFRY